MDQHECGPYDTYSAIEIKLETSIKSEIKQKNVTKNTFYTEI